jgi:hypothetical protein
MMEREKKGREGKKKDKRAFTKRIMNRARVKVLEKAARKARRKETRESGK